MGGSQKLFGIPTNLIVGDSISDIIHKLGSDLEILVVFHVTWGFNATQYLLKLALDPIEGAVNESAQDRLGGDK